MTKENKTVRNAKKEIERLKKENRRDETIVWLKYILYLALVIGMGFAIIYFLDIESVWAIIAIYGACLGVFFYLVFGALFKN
ncbi:MAG: hypothetical protein IKJ78_09190 [Bacteroidales bacterium]|nr:hypothetical protein [Bacteroidales bacterium]